jgi:hypothetical protein
MLRHIICILVAIALTGELASRMLVAQDTKCEGTIVKIEGESVTVKDRSEEQEMKIKPATKITHHGKPANAMDLKIGQQVRCVCQWNENEMICTSVEIVKEN